MSNLTLANFKIMLGADPDPDIDDTTLQALLDDVDDLWEAETGCTYDSNNTIHTMSLKQLARYVYNESVNDINSKGAAGYSVQGGTWTTFKKEYPPTLTRLLTVAKFTG